MHRERKTTDGEDYRVDDDPKIEVYESSGGEDSHVDDDPKIEVYESDGEEELATASGMPLPPRPTAEASDDKPDGCDRRRERWRRRVRRAVAARWEKRGTVAEKSGKDEYPPSAKAVVSFVSLAGITNDLGLLESTNGGKPSVDCIGAATSDDGSGGVPSFSLDDNRIFHRASLEVDVPRRGGGREGTCLPDGIERASHVTESFSLGCDTVDIEFDTGAKHIVDATYCPNWMDDTNEGEPSKMVETAASAAPVHSLVPPLADDAACGGEDRTERTADGSTKNEEDVATGRGKIPRKRGFLKRALRKTKLSLANKDSAEREGVAKGGAAEKESVVGVVARSNQR
jgi:hypothetical protein